MLRIGKLKEKNKSPRPQIQLNQNRKSLYKYNITTSDSHKFVWFRNAKVGTRTILHQLETSNERVQFESESAKLFFQNRYREYFKFAIVRDPYNRLVSAWEDKIVKNNLYKFDEKELEKMQVFSYFVDYVASLDIDFCDRHIRRQTRLIDLNEVDYIGHMERFSDDLKYIFSRIKIPLQKLEARNKTEKKIPYHERYTQSLRKKVYEIYKKDFHILGYEHGF